MSFFLFILLTGMIFVRPGEIIPALVGWQFFFYLAVPCIFLSFQSICGQLSGRSLQEQPITLCILGLLLAMLASNLAHFDIDAATSIGRLFLQNVIYYLLLVSLVNTPSRLRWLLFWLWLFTVFSIVLALLQFHGFIELSNMEAVDSRFVMETGEETMSKRMTGSGLFADPNDLCVVIVIGFILSIYLIGERFFRLPRLLYVMSLLVFGYGLMKTQSRGGFIALMVACSVLLMARYGWKKAVMLGGAVLPVLLVIFKGRLTAISTQEATSHSRIELWSDGVEFFKSSPIFGIGAGKFADFTSGHHVAHNAYVQAYAELGLFGGPFFTGAFFLPYGGFIA